MQVNLSTYLHLTWNLSNQNQKQSQISFIITQRQQNITSLRGTIRKIFTF